MNKKHNTLTVNNMFYDEAAASEEGAIMEEFTRLVIMGCHPECETYEAALMAELGFGCVIDVGWTTEPREPHYVVVLRVLESNNWNRCNYLEIKEYIDMQEIVEYKDNFDIDRAPLGEIYAILGLPITIGRTLVAMNRKDNSGTPEYGIDSGGGILHDFCRSTLWNNDGSSQYVWQFLKEDGSEATADDQKIETIVILLNLLKTQNHGKS